MRNVVVKDATAAVFLKISEIAYASIAGVLIMSYATSHLRLSRGLVLNGAFIASFVALFPIPLFGWLSDKVRRKAMFFASCLFSAVFAVPMFWLLDTRDPMPPWIAMGLSPAERERSVMVCVAGSKDDRLVPDL